jgi:LacI family transcriptional regulator
MVFDVRRKGRTRATSTFADALPPNRPARIRDIARAAGVSAATVDRVLNRRPNVRAITEERVLRAAASLNYLLPDTDLHGPIKPKTLKLVFLLPAGTNRVHRMFADAVEYSEDRLAQCNVECRCEFVKGFNPHVLAASLLRLSGSADGIAFMAIEHPLVREAVNTLSDDGVPTITLISDLSASRRCAYIGLDNRSAGRTAGYLLGRFIGPRPGKLALIAGSLSYRAHEEREAGFLHVIHEMFPALEVVGLREGFDDPEKNYRQTRQLLEQFQDLVGIYNVGGASDGVARALNEAGRAPNVVFIGHGLTPDTRAMLIDGTMDAVITQNMQSAMMNCVRIFTNLRDRRDFMNEVEPAPITVVLRENLP